MKSFEFNPARNRKKLKNQSIKERFDSLFTSSEVRPTVYSIKSQFNTMTIVFTIEWIEFASWEI